MVLLDMLSSLSNNCTYMAICQRVKDRLSLSAAVDQFVLF